MTLIRKFFSLTFAEQWLFIKALFLSLIIKLMVKLLPMRWYKTFLEYPVNFNCKNSASETLINQISIAVNRSSRCAPWKNRCLVDAITAKLLLQQYHVKTTLYLGVSKEGGNNLIAHAWLKYDEKFITGKKGCQKFTVVSSFA
jgi:hypothetical protein